VSAHPVSEPAGSDLLERLRAEPGGAELLAAATPGTYLVGGAVRDLLLDRHPRELDVVVEGGPLGHAVAALAGTLASALGAPAPACEHERFGTAIVEWEGGRIDIATARRERYPAPGALPEVQAAPLAEDLLRRDFTVNTLALALAGERAGELREAPHAVDDLHGELLRVLHERSFLDDPTRLWRLARYRARLGFAVEEHTAALAAAALARGALSTVSPARVGAELRLALAEAHAVATLTALEDLGVFAALHPQLRFDAELAGDALAQLAAAEGGTEPDPRPDLLLLATVLQPLAADIVAEGAERDLHALLNGWEFPAAERDLVLRAAIGAEVIADELRYAEHGSEIYELVSGEPLEGIALAGAWAGGFLSDGGSAADRWLAELRNVRLLITGADLLAAGIPEGPEIGRRLRAALCAKLDGELDDPVGGREAELAVALGAL
jgi:tRNA nucleotidyltransferase (CCA-adding enzyme)